jgi:hypothetical protein
MNVNELFESKYVAAADLRGQDVVVTIAEVDREEVGDDKKKCPVLKFQGMKKSMVMNRTNCKRIAKMYGTETANWIGKPITLYPSVADFKGEEVPCIRVRDLSATMIASIPPQQIQAAIAAPVQAVAQQQPTGSPTF